MRVSDLEKERIREPSLSGRVEKGREMRGRPHSGGIFFFRSTISYYHRLEYSRLTCVQGSGKACTTLAVIESRREKFPPRFEVFPSALLIRIGFDLFTC